MTDPAEIGLLPVLQGGIDRFLDATLLFFRDDAAAYGAFKITVLRNQFAVAAIGADKKLHFCFQIDFTTNESSIHLPVTPSGFCP